MDSSLGLVKAVVHKNWRGGMVDSESLKAQGCFMLDSGVRLGVEAGREAHKGGM